MSNSNTEQNGTNDKKEENDGLRKINLEEGKMYDKIKEAIKFLQSKADKLKDHQGNIAGQKDDYQKEIRDLMFEVKRNDINLQELNENKFKAIAHAQNLNQKEGGGSGQDEVRTRIFTDFLKAIELSTERMDFKKMDVFILYGDTKHSFSFSYIPEKLRGEGSGPEILSTIGDLKQKATKDLNFESGILLTDEFDNILLDNLDIVDTLYPFYEFQIRETFPLVKAILPYGWDGKKFVSQGASQQKAFQDENDALTKIYHMTKKKLISSSKPLFQQGEEEEEDETSKSVGSIIMHFLKKTGRMLYMVTIIAAYWYVFIPRTKVQENLKFLATVESIEASIRGNMVSSENYSFDNFVENYFNTIESSDALTQNAVLSKMAVFQRRYVKKECTSFSEETKKFIESNKNIFECYDFEGKESEEQYGDGSEGFVYKEFPGITFSTLGKEYTTKNGFYMFPSTAPFTSAETLLKEKISKGWVDAQTKYVGFILNLYQPNFELMLVIVTLYDFRFGYNILSNVNTRSTAIITNGFTLFELILIIYMFLSCFISIFIVYAELFLTVNKVTEAEVLKYLRDSNPDLQHNTKSKVKLWIQKEKKRTRVLIKPNFFHFVTVINFIVMFVTLIFRMIIAKQLQNFNLTSDNYIDVLTVSSTLRLMKIVDGINTILIFFSLFYYSSLTVPVLRKISAFFLSIAKEMANLMLMFLFMVFVFAVLFHSFYEKNIPILNDFSSSFVSTMNLAMGNQFLNEDDELIEDQGEGYYYIFLIVEYIWMYMIMLVLIYVITGREFLNHGQKVQGEGETGTGGGKIEE